MVDDEGGVWLPMAYSAGNVIRFQTGSADGLTEAQVLVQMKMYIAAVRIGMRSVVMQ